MGNALAKENKSMRIRLRAAVICAALLTIMSPCGAQQTYNSGLLNFLRGGHNQWGAPGDFGLVDWQASTGLHSIDLPFGLLVNLDPTGITDLETGAALIFTLTGEAGIDASVTGKNGTVTVSYPA